VDLKKYTSLLIPMSNKSFLSVPLFGKQEKSEVLYRFILVFLFLGHLFKTFDLDLIIGVVLDFESGIKSIWIFK